MMRISSLILILLLFGFHSTQAQIPLPRPHGPVNDFAKVLSPSDETRIDSIIQEVRHGSGGEIVVVTLPSLRHQSRQEVALQIGREWKVGRKGNASQDPAAQTGTVVLVVPSEHQVQVELGRGTGRFISAAEAGRIRNEMIPFFRKNQYGEGIHQGVYLLGEAYARKFGFAFGNVPAATAPQKLIQPDEARPSASTSRPFIPWLIFGALLFGAATLLKVLRRQRKERDRNSLSNKSSEEEHENSEPESSEPRVYHIRTPDSARTSSPSRNRFPQTRSPEPDRNAHPVHNSWSNPSRFPNPSPSESEPPSRNDSFPTFDSPSPSSPETYPSEPPPADLGGGGAFDGNGAGGSW